MPDSPDDVPPSPSADATEGPLPLVELETLLSRPPSHRKHLVYLSLVLVLVVVAVVTLHSALLPQRPLPAATPTLDVALLSPAVLVQSNVTYGTITLNGHKQAVSPPLVAALQGQTYDLTLTAPPFRPISCHVISPPPPSAGAPPAFTQQGHCSVLRYGATTKPGIISLHGVFADPTLVIGVDATAADLPPDQQDQVTSLLTQTLTTQPSTSVPPGEFIATGVAPDGTITSTRASESLEATAFLAPSTAFLPRFSFCGTLICPRELSPYLYSSFAAFPTNSLWAVQVPIGLRWQFHDAAGHVVSEVSFPPGSGITLFLSYNTQPGWQVAQHDFVPGSDAPAAQLTTTLCSEGMLYQYLEPKQPAKSFLSILHDQGMAGCEFILQQNVPNQSQNVDLGHLVWRFGVLLAADDQAHALYPDLPIASPEAIAAVGG
jgi:hypothetical protein